VTDAMTVMQLSAGLQNQITATTDCVCPIALNQTLSRKFQKWCKFSCHIKVKLQGHMMWMDDKRTPTRILEWKPTGTRI